MKPLMPPPALPTAVANLPIPVERVPIPKIDVAQEDGEFIVLLVVRWNTDQARTGLPGFPVRLSRLDSGPLCLFTFGQYDAMSVILASAYRNGFSSKRRIQQHFNGSVEAVGVAVQDRSHTHMSSPQIMKIIFNISLKTH